MANHAHFGIDHDHPVHADQPITPSSLQIISEFFVSEFDFAENYVAILVPGNHGKKFGTIYPAHVDRQFPLDLGEVFNKP
jgi:hypothetical protein